MKPETFMVHGIEVRVDGSNLDMSLFWQLVKSFVLTPEQVVGCANDKPGIDRHVSYYICHAIDTVGDLLLRHTKDCGAAADRAEWAMRWVNDELGANQAFLPSTLPWDEQNRRSAEMKSKVSGNIRLAEVLWRQEYRHEWLADRIQEC